MTQARLIRHGESAANAGLSTHDPALIELTPTGIAQARQIADSLSCQPRLVITSPFIRARATAMPTLDTYPQVPVCTWPVQEFTYLTASRCAHTTTAARRPWVEAYWCAADPDYRDGPDAETFREFIERAQAFLDRLEGCEQDDIVVFSHGQFISAVVWLLRCPGLPIDHEGMCGYRRFEQQNNIANGWGYSICQSGDGRWRLGPYVDAQGVSRGGSRLQAPVTVPTAPNCCSNATALLPSPHPGPDAESP